MCIDELIFLFLFVCFFFLFHCDSCMKKTLFAWFYSGGNQFLMRSGHGQPHSVSKSQALG